MKTFLSIIVALLVVVLGFSWYLGIFSSMKIEERSIGGYTVVGLEFIGPYSEAGKTMIGIDEKLKKLGVTSAKGFGIYYDDPKMTAQEKCRSFVGNILEEKDFNKIPEIKSAGFKVDSVPVSTAVVTEFPAKTSLSYMIGPLKAYPALSKYMTEKKYNVTLSLEVYDVPAKRIQYIMQYK